MKIHYKIIIIVCLLYVAYSIHDYQSQRVNLIETKNKRIDKINNINKIIEKKRSASYINKVLKKLGTILYLQKKSNKYEFLILVNDPQKIAQTGAICMHIQNDEQDQYMVKGYFFT